MGHTPPDLTPVPQGIPFNGVDSTFYYTPDTTDLKVTGDLDLRGRIKVDSYNTGAWQPILGKWSTGDYLLAILNNTIYFYYNCTAGALAQTVSVASVPVGRPIWFRGVLDINNSASGHTVFFYWSYDGVNWTSLGSVTVAGAVTWVHTTDSLELGSWASGGVKLLGTLYEAEVRNGIDGPIVSRIDGRNLGDFYTYRESSGRIWTQYGYALRGGMGLSSGAYNAKVAAGSTGVLDATDPTVNGRVATVTVTANRGHLATDVGKVVEMDVASANTYTVQPNSTVATPADALIEVCQIGAGQTTIAAGAGVTILPSTKLKIGERYGSISLRRRGSTDTWIIAGNLVA